MSPISKESTAFEKFRRENPQPNAKKDLAEDPQKREWKTKERTDGKGGIKTEVEQRFYREGAMIQQGVQEDKNFIHIDKKGREVEKDVDYERKMPVTSRQTNELKESNPDGVRKAFAAAGAVGAIEEVNKWAPLLADLHYGTTANKIATREKLEKAVFDANNFPVPPKPERVRQMKRDLISYRYNTQSEFQRVQTTMKRLEDVSYAFWNR